METIMNGMCRCCASEGVYKDVKGTYTWMGEEEVYADMLRECFDISLSTSEHGEDGGICEVCITQLRNASNFKKQVQHTEEQFKKHVENKLFKPSIVKVEMTGDEDNDSDDNNLSAEEGFSAPEYEVPIKTESEEQKPKKRASTSKATTSRAKKAKNDNGESSTTRSSEENIITEIDGKKCCLTGKRTIITSTRHKDKTKDILELNKHRTNIQEVIFWSNATPIRRCGDLGYMCCYCEEQYLDPAGLKEHTLAQHKHDLDVYFFTKLYMDRYFIKLDITGLKCDLCEQTIDTIEQMLQHLKIDHDKPIYTDIKNHIIPFKFLTESLQCCICMDTFTKFKILQEHMHNHYRNYTCEICDLGYFNYVSLVTHKLSHGTGTFKCGHCSLMFKSKSNRRLHEQTKHRDKPFQIKCGQCNEIFSDFRKKEAHMVSLHGLKVPTAKCEFCDKVFTDRNKLQAHVKRVHLMQRLHKCSECDMSFFSSVELKNHMVKHTGVRPYVCTVCSKAFGRYKTLKEHSKIHDDTKRLKCEHCGQTFVQKCSLRSHLKSKHGATT